MKKFNITQIRNDFPILKQKIGEHNLVYFDNAATTQKPNTVISAISEFYTKNNANVHRGIHYLSEVASEQYENCRDKVAKFINARSRTECIFTKNATEAINLVAATYGKENIKTGDEIVISIMEHHANFVPWQKLCKEQGATLKIIPLDNNGDLDLEKLKELLTSKTKLLAINHISNSIGTINPIEKIIKIAHNLDIPVLIDGAQAGSHITIDVNKLDCDFYVLAPHKMFAPTGIGILYAKEKHLEQMPPYQTGGDMILKVSVDETIYNELPYKFEAGTPAIAEAIGLSAALDYINSLDKSMIYAHKTELYHYLKTELEKVPGIKIIGNAKNKIALAAFTLEGIHPHDIGTILNNYGIAVRTGHHCTMPLLEYLKVGATTRASLAMYNTKEEIDKLISGLYECIKLFKRR